MRGNAQAKAYELFLGSLAPLSGDLGVQPLPRARLPALPTTPFRIGTIVLSLLSTFSLLYCHNPKLCRLGEGMNGDSGVSFMLLSSLQSGPS